MIQTRWVHQFDHCRLLTRVGSSVFQVSSFGNKLACVRRGKVDKSVESSSWVCSFGGGIRRRFVVISSISYGGELLLRP